MEKARRIAREHHGPPPWRCHWCEDPVLEFGPRRDDGVVHHL